MGSISNLSEWIDIDCNWSDYVIKLIFFLFYLFQVLACLLGRVASAGQSDNEVIVAIDDPDKTQYHAANFDTSKFNYLKKKNQQTNNKIR